MESFINSTQLVNEEFHPAKSGYMSHVIAVIFVSDVTVKSGNLCKSGHSSNLYMFRKVK